MRNYPHHHSLNNHSFFYHKFYYKEARLPSSWSGRARHGTQQLAALTITTTGATATAATATTAANNRRPHVRFFFGSS